MQTTAHALGRMAGRLTKEDRDRVTAALGRVTAHKYRSSVAVRVARLSRAYGDPWADASNGSDVWAVIRGGSVTTIMLRRKQQPTNPSAFGVERVVILTEEN